MRDVVLRSGSGIAFATLAVFCLAWGAPASLEAKTCKEKDENAVRITIDCSACDADATCTIDEKSVKIAAAHNAGGSKKVQVCWEVVNSPDGEFTITPLEGQTDVRKELFKKGGKPFKFAATATSETSGKVREKAFKKAQKNGVALWDYEVQLVTTSGKTCKADPRICVREQGGDACPP